MDEIEEGTSSGPPTPPLITNHPLNISHDNFLVDEGICLQREWDLLRLDDPHTELNEQLFDEDGFTLSNMPDVVMQCIFQSFDLRDRCVASQVCKRWHYLLTCRFPMEDVTVLNIFQNKIYRDKISNNRNIGLKCYHIDKADYLLIALKHCRSISSVKIWFEDADFAGEVLKRLKQVKIRMRCLDLYPYHTEKALDQAFNSFPDLTGIVLYNDVHFFQEKALDQAFNSFPDLTGMTMRPHGQEFFWSGLDMYSFPKFTKMDTLMLDGFNIKPEVFLPESLTTLEWLNRSGKFLRVMPKLRYLVNLEYLMLGHAEFWNTDEFDSFLKVISSENLPKLQYLIFRYCKIDAHKRPSISGSPYDDCKGDSSRSAMVEIAALDVKLSSLQMIKLDLCYADLNFVIRRITSFTGAAMRVISLNVISEETNYDRIYDLSTLIAERKLTLHFGILQKDMRPEREEDTMNFLKPPPPTFSAILGRFEASFLSDELNLKTLLLTHPTPRLTDLKFIQASAVSEHLLLHLSLTAPRLRKLSLINCNEGELDAGILSFISSLTMRISKTLQIIWKRKYNRPMSFYNTLIKKHSDLVKDFQVRVIPKKFAANKDGERIVIWETKTWRTLYIQDFDLNDQGRILGIVMPPDEKIGIRHVEFLENGENSSSSVHL